MRQSSHIRQLIACLLLVLAMLGSTPRKYLHDALAGHTDRTASVRADGAVVAAQTLDCGFYHQVAESPFAGASLPVLPACPVVHRVVQFANTYTDPVTGFAINGDGRGPPSRSCA